MEALLRVIVWALLKRAVEDVVAEVGSPTTARQ